MASVKAANPDAIIDIICHSQGSVVAALAKLVGVRKIIFTAPSFTSDVTKMVKNFESRPGTKINITGMSELARADGSITLVPAEYWAEKDIKIMELYQQLAQLTELIIINAKQDNILGTSDFSSLKNVEIINLDGKHNFSGKDRKKLLEVIGAKLM